MVGKSSETQKARPLRTELEGDGVGKKLFPNSLRLLLNSIRRYWPDQDPSGDGQGVDAFMPYFEPRFRDIEEKYRGHKKNGDLQGLVHRLERGSTDISYYHLRTYSEITKMPLGLFCIFSHIVGDSAKGYSRSEIFNFIESSQKGLEALRLHLEASSDVDQTLRRIDSGGRPYTVKLDALLAMQRAFWLHRAKPSSQLDDLVG